jgi:uncharacterized membrane-anchored protein
MRLRCVLMVAGLVLALVVVNLGIAGRERLLRDGAVALLELAPVDPRSIMQGDYMALRFAIAQPLQAAIGDDARHRDGFAVLALADDGRASFVREQASSEPLSTGEVALRYRLRAGQLRIVTNAWFFAEGEAARWQPARFGELRLGADGEALLVGLRDEALAPL